MAIANQVHLEMAETVDLCPSSILGSFWLHQSLAHLLKHGACQQLVSRLLASQVSNGYLPSQISPCTS